MWASERRQKEQLEAEGWTVVRNGWPDFLLVREIDGEMQIRAIEVKGVYKNGTIRQTLTPAQELTHKALKTIGLKVEVIYDEPGKNIS